MLLGSVLTTVGAAAQSLDLAYTVSQDRLAPGDRVYYTLAVGNSGAGPISDLVVRVLLPAGIFDFEEQTDEGFDCPFSDCDPNELALWTIGTLAPGQTRTLVFTTRFSTSADAQSYASTATATAPGLSDLVTSATVAVAAEPVVRLALASERAPLSPTAETTYMLTYGNLSGRTLTEATLSLPVPEGLRFVSATGGGTESGGIVRWNVAPLGVNGGGQVRATFEPASMLTAGTLVRAEATLGPAPSVAAATVAPVEQPGLLRLSYTTSQSSFGEGQRVLYRLLLTNTGTTTLLDPSVRLRLSNFIEDFEEQTDIGFDCPFSDCDPNELAVWSVGPLAPGASRTLVFTTRVSTSAPSGEVLRSWATAEATGTSQVVAQADLHVEPAPLLRLSVAPQQEPAQPGEPFTYVITFANLGPASPNDLVLQVRIPDESGLISTTGPRAGISQGVVTWGVGALEPGEGGRVEVKVRVDQDAPAGTSLDLIAWLAPNIPGATTLTARSAVAVAPPSDLAVSYRLDRQAALPGDLVVFQVRAENTGATSLAGVQARLRLPAFISDFVEQTDVGFDCPFSDCDPNELAVWTVGTLAPGQSRTLTFSTTVSGSAPDGEVLRSPLVARATGLSDALTQADLVVGRALDLQPPAPPTDLVATPGDQQVALSWTASPDADDLAGYLLQQGIERNGSLVYDFLAIVDPPATSFVSTGLENGTTYFYVVTAFDAAGNENDFLESARAEATPQDGVAPAPPTGLAAGLDAGTVALTWTANADADLDGYRLYRDLASAPTSLLTALPAAATAFTDADVEDGTTYFYRLTAVDDDGNESPFSNEVEILVTSVSAEDGPALPTAFALDAVYPNPVAGAATVAYALPEAASVTVEVFDLLGARVAVLADVEQPAGYHGVGWTPYGLAAGTYLVRLRAGDFAATRRLVVFR